MLIRGEQRGDYSLFGEAGSVKKFGLRTCLSLDDKRAVRWGFDFELFGAAGTLKIFCWSENADPPERDIFVTKLDKKLRTVRL